MDLIRVLERAIRRARIPVAFSEGFNPRPRMSFGPPLPLGATSDAEIAILRLSASMDASEAQTRLNAELPAGIEITEAHMVASDERPLQAIRGSGYLARVVLRNANPADALGRAVREFVEREKVVVERTDARGAKRIDIRRCVESLELVETSGEIGTLRIRIAHGGQHIAKPAEVVQALSEKGRDVELVSVHRESLY